VDGRENMSKNKEAVLAKIKKEKWGKTRKDVSLSKVKLMI
jgi:hypothetical protein